MLFRSVDTMIFLRISCAATLRRGLGLCPPLGSGGLPPHAGEIERRAGQGDFPAHLTQSAQAHPPHAALLFQHPDHRFHQRLTPPVTNLSQRAAQASPHPAVFRTIPRHFQWPAVMLQFPAQVRVGYETLDAPRFQAHYVGHREEGAVGARLERRRSSDRAAWSIWCARGAWCRCRCRCCRCGRRRRWRE